MASSPPSCESGFLVLGLVDGEKYIAPAQLAATLVTLTVSSAWFSLEKIKRLGLFFAHWLSGLVAGLGFTIESLMISLCWTGTNLEGLIKTIKFVELAAFNMLAITNLAICVNLALIVMAHRTVSRVKSVSSLPLILLLLAISLMLAAVSVPFWDILFVLGSVFGIMGSDEANTDFINVSHFYVEFFVGVCMFVMVAWLLLFCITEIKECWKIHRRMRYYFGLTLVGTGVNLAIGICGVVNVINTTEMALVWAWLFRYIHIALDTVVLYGALIEKNNSERGDRSSLGSGSLSSGRLVSGRGPKRGSGASNNTSKVVTFVPAV